MSCGPQLRVCVFLGLAPRRMGASRRSSVVLLPSGGLGSMGFGLPSALGAAAAYAEEGREAKVVVDIDGDGSFLMNVQVELHRRPEDGDFCLILKLRSALAWSAARRPACVRSCVVAHAWCIVSIGKPQASEPTLTPRPLQELATVAVDALPTKIMILNNQHLGMVVQWEDRFYKANRAHTYLGRRVRLK